ncbi:MAG: carbohydrate kinase, YjeF related protein [Bryobacterales bacterium]|nr:carbohydrate kinase, YjeF related protein [Bryobacterales bacterium]
MQAVDRRTIELGIPGVVLMENAGLRTVEFLERRFAPLDAQRIVIFCGKGNNGGDGMVIARQLHTRFHPRALHVVLIAAPEDLRGDAALNLRMLTACGCPFDREVKPETAAATIVIDAVLGTGLKGPASGLALDAIRRMNTGFPSAKVVAVDIPSGIASDSGKLEGEFVRADFTVTFTAPKVAQALPPACDAMGELIVCPIGSPPALYSEDESIRLALVESSVIAPLFAPRKKDANKGTYGHVLAVAGSRGRSGAAAMCGIATLRAGAGLVTVASAASAIPLIAGYAPEVMTEALPETPAGDLAESAMEKIQSLANKKTLLAVGPGLGTAPETAALVRRLFQESELPVVADADALNALAGTNWSGNGRVRVLTPHPGEMSRLTGKSIAEVQADRTGTATALAQERRVIVVLKGQRTLIAFPDGRVWINPTGSPAMATGGTGDILTGLVSGMMAQFQSETDLAIAAAVYLHGLAGEIGATHLTESCLIATDLLRFLPDAIHACTNVPHAV